MQKNDSNFATQTLHLCLNEKKFWKEIPKKVILSDETATDFFIYIFLFHMFTNNYIRSLFSFYKGKPGYKSTFQCFEIPRYLSILCLHINSQVKYKHITSGFCIY